MLVPSSVACGGTQVIHREDEMRGDLSATVVGEATPCEICGAPDGRAPLATEALRGRF